jgi:hypothetical protein
VGQVGRAELEPLPAPSSDGLAAINAAIDELFETKARTASPLSPLALAPPPDSLSAVR